MAKEKAPSDRSGVYEIVSPSGRRYVGSAAVFSVRWAQHRRLLRAGTHHSPALQAAWIKYGEDAMIFRVLEVMDGDREARLAREQFYIDENIARGYNVNRFARSREGTPQSDAFVEKHTERMRREWADPKQRERRMAGMATIDKVALEAKRQATLAERGYRFVMTPEHKAKMVAISNGRKGIPTERVFTPETRAKISAANARHYASGARRVDGENHPMFGKTHTEEARAKQSAAKKGKTSVHRLADPTRCAKRLHPWIVGQKECRPCANIANKASRLARIARLADVPT